jgi:hypothetical protein
MISSTTKKSINIIMFLILSFLFFGYKAWSADYSITQVTNNEYSDEYPKINGGQIVWLGYVANPNNYDVFLYKDKQIIRITDDTSLGGRHDFNCQIYNGQIAWQRIGGLDGTTKSVEIYLYNDKGISQLTDNNYLDNYPQIHNGQVVWLGSVGIYNQIFLYDGSHVGQLTNDDSWKSDPQIHNGQITWYGRSTTNVASNEIFFYDGTKILRLTNNNYPDLAPQINNGQVVWQGWDGNDYEIFFYDGAQTIQLTNNDYYDGVPQINNGQVTWTAYDGHDYEIFLYNYNDKQTIQLTNNDYTDSGSQIYNGQVTWTGYPNNSGEIFLYDGKKTTQLTNNNYTDYRPMIHNGQVTWQGWDGHDYEIFLAKTGFIKIPLGGQTTDTDQSNTYRIYAPDRNGGTLTITTDNGVVELYYPDASTKIIGPDDKIEYAVPPGSDKYGWYYVKHFGAPIQSTYTIANTFVQKGEASYRPWNFWYWPLKKRADSAENLYVFNGPLDKYDKVFDTQARQYEEAIWGGDKWQGWEGYCWGGTVASILLPQPQGASYKDQSFSQEEMEGLVIKLANTSNLSYELLTPYVPAIKPQSGVDEVDEFAHKFHRGLVKYLRIEKEKKPLQANLRDATGEDPSAIWNFAIYKYVSEMKEADGGDEKIIRITTNVFAPADTDFPSFNGKDQKYEYVYKLRYKLEDGNIDDTFVGNGQDWISATGFYQDQQDNVLSAACFAPRTLKNINSSSFDGMGYPNTFVTKENAEDIRGEKFP